MNPDALEKPIDYWAVSGKIKDIYMSESLISTLLDFERVLDEMDLYAFKNWQFGELIDGPRIGRYTVTCVFLWPLEFMPDPKGGKRLLPFGVKIKYKKTAMSVPIKIKEPEDFKPGTKKPKLMSKPIWMVSIEIPKYLINDIKTGSSELEGQDIDMEELDQAYEQDLDKQTEQDET